MAANNSVDKDVDILYKAMKGIGTDEDKLNLVICFRDNQHLQLVRKRYQELHKVDLIKEIKGETSGPYEDLLVALLEEDYAYLAQLVDDAVRGLGTNEDLLIDMICTRSDAELKKICASYQTRFGKDMLKTILDDLSGDFKILVQSLFTFKRAEGPVNADLAKKDADFLFQAGEGKLGTNENAFIEILTHRNRPHLEQVSRAYADKTGHTLDKAITAETSGSFKKAMIALTTPLPDYFAKRITECIAGAGTDEANLVRICTGLKKEELKQVNQVFTKMHGYTLQKKLTDETSGDFRNALISIIPLVQ